jgi:hypothetical protein
VTSVSVPSASNSQPWFGLWSIRPTNQGFLPRDDLEQGAARRLIRRSLAATQADGCKVVPLYVDADCLTSAVYGRMGFTELACAYYTAGAAM